ncbi:MAG: amidohydrolase [Chloroflexi bacterium]|nr:amidohydrolase [Chloroflexota bacterium]
MRNDKPNCYHTPMRIDAHVHAFPKAMALHRDRYAARDATFRELYAHPKAAIATVDRLLESMDAAGIDLSVLTNIGWATAAMCRETNDYILDAARRHPKRLIPFCTVNPRLGKQAVAEIERCAALGAHGIGELHPDPQGFDLADKRVMSPIVDAAMRHDLVVLCHASEPVGHAYPGKGTVTPQVLYRFVTNFPEARIVLAHWGGGLPFYALMPEVRRALANVWFDTATSPFLYEPGIWQAAASVVGPDRILFGTDYPLIKQERLLCEVENASLPEKAKRAILGMNAARLLGL